MLYRKVFFSLLIISLVQLGIGGGLQAQFFKNLKKKAADEAAKTAKGILNKKKDSKEHKEPNTSSQGTTAQKKLPNEKTSEQEQIDFSDILILEPSEPAFKAIHLQKHNGLPRFGAQNLYYAKGKHNLTPMGRKKKTLLDDGYVNYFNLIKMKYMKAYYDDIDKTSLTVLTKQNMTNKQVAHSHFAQQHLNSLVGNIGTEETRKKYFCAAIQECGDFKQWGGFRDEFEAHEKYNAFAAKHLNNLRAWSETLFKDDIREAFLVNRYQFYKYNRAVLEYDFDKNGFWINVVPNMGNFGPQFRMSGNPISELLPVTDYGNAHLNRMTDVNNYYPKVLFPIAPDAAEALLNRKPEFLYSTLKVKIVFKALTSQNLAFPNVQYTYHFADPILVFYEDVELTKKIGELSLKNLIYKEK